MNGGKTYLDEQGNPIQGTKVYLDENGNPTGQPTPTNVNAQGLSPEVEALRQRNMAEAMRQGGSPLAQSVQVGRDAQAALQQSQMPDILKNLLGIMTRPIQSGEEAALQAQQGNVLGGGLGIGNAITQGAFALPSAVNEAVGQIPFAGRALTAIPNAALTGAGAIGQMALSPLAGLIPQEWTGKTPEQQQYTAEQAKQTAQTLGQVGAGELLAKGLQQAGPVAERGATRLEGAAQKPPYIATKGIDQFDRQIQTTLRENISPTRGGLKKVGGILDDLDKTADPLKKQATENGVTVNFNDFSNYLDGTKAQYANDADFAEKSAAIDGMKARIESLANAYPDGNVPFEAAWRFKKTLQDMVGGKYDQSPTTTGYSKELAKEAAHGLLDDMLTKVPELREIGLRQRDLLEAQSMIEKRVSQTTKQDIVSRRVARGIGAGALGFYAGGVEGSLMAGVGEAALESPFLQHKAAIALDRLANLGKSKVDPYAGYTPRPFTAGPTPPTVAPPPISPAPPSSTGTPPPANPLPPPTKPQILGNPVAGGMEDVAGHRRLVESNGATYLGTDKSGHIWYDDVYAGTGMIRKGTTPSMAAQAIKTSNATPKP